MEARLSLDYASVFTVLSGLVEVGIVVLNSDGEMDFASDRARSLLGCRGRSDVDACYPATRDAIRELVETSRSGQRRSARKNVQFDLDGKQVDLHLESHPIEEDSCTGVLVLVKDAENMRKMATDLGLAAQLRNTRRLYHAVVQHLKQPISVVLLHADMIKDALPPEDAGDDPPKGVRSVEIIRSQINELNHSLTLLLEEIAPSDTEERGFSLRDVLKDVTRLILPSASRQDVEIDLRCGEHAARLNGYRQRVKQALLNVAVNALDAMPDGGKLTLELKVSGSLAEVSIHDSGKGIDPDVIDHIFEIHYTTKDTGTGVGLYVARDVISKHGGDIQVDTVPDRGSTFRVVLPVSENGS